MSRLAPSLLLVATLWFPSLSFALTQPNGTTIPSPPGCASGQPTGLAAVFACQCSAAGFCDSLLSCEKEVSG